MAVLDGYCVLIFDDRSISLFGNAKFTIPEMIALHKCTKNTSGISRRYPGF